MIVENSPLVSVVIPCYNHEKYVKDCIQSIIDQTYKNIELIIIDDGSKDSSVEKIKQMIPACKERFVRFEFRNRSNKGLSPTLNEALEWCKGKYYAPLASDDKFMINKIYRQVEILEQQKDVEGVFGNLVLIDNLDKKIKTLKCKAKKYYFDDLFLNGEFLTAPSQMLRLNIVKKTGGYSNYLIEDWYMYLKILANSKALLYVDEDYTYYRQHKENLSKNFHKMIFGRLQITHHFIEKKGAESVLIKLYWEAIFFFLLKNLKLSFKCASFEFIKIFKKICGKLKFLELLKGK